MVHQRLSILRQSESERHTFRRNNKTSAFGCSTIDGLNDVNQLSVRVTISALIVWAARSPLVYCPSPSCYVRAPQHMVNGNW